MEKNTKILLTIAVIAIVLWYLRRENKKSSSTDLSNSGASQNSNSNVTPTSRNEGSDFSAENYQPPYDPDDDIDYDQDDEDIENGFNNESPVVLREKVLTKGYYAENGLAKQQLRYR